MKFTDTLSPAGLWTPAHREAAEAMGFSEISDIYYSEEKYLLKHKELHEIYRFVHKKGLASTPGRVYEALRIVAQSSQPADRTRPAKEAHGHHPRNRALARRLRMPVKYTWPSTSAKKQNMNLENQRNREAAREAVELSLSWAPLSGTLRPSTRLQSHRGKDHRVPQEADRVHGGQDNKRRH